MALGKREVSAHHRFGKVTAIATTTFTLGKLKLHFRESNVVSHFGTRKRNVQESIISFYRIGIWSFDK